MIAHTIGGNPTKLVGGSKKTVLRKVRPSPGSIRTRQLEGILERRQRDSTYA
jgi:hypothetical protein